MQRFNQYEPFNVFRFEVTEWPYPLHNHSYFEIIFIEKGQGIHCLNEHQFTYQEGDVFLLRPQDYHIFAIASSTQFCYLRFTESFFQNNQEPHWQQTIDYLFNTPYHIHGSLVKMEEEKKRLHGLLAVLIHEYEHRQKPFAENILTYIMRSVLSLLARNIFEQSFLTEKETPKRSHLLDSILVYVRQHIYSPEKLRMEQLADHLHYSANYLSIFFKRQMGESLQQYILRYKLKLVESRLVYSDWSISQIAFELGFSDESHLNKLFKKYYQYTPGDFRKRMIESKTTAALKDFA
ncbi:AraC family transcriptional regulator [Xanthocytophaga agilis]|uniref:AraC family transcriptional regulator n=1 Tax=Xanthocytophaga agilis TaxID=3048010 RepID=A0AAE3UE81_9BACT|nr:AraC family transcriptional regulator [Xanthocytophaga agilis]MDJ1501915.1 AraC family transcriptional regulator [Xanthocytophaga agilis]